MNKKINYYKIYKHVFRYWEKKNLLNYHKNSKKKYIIYDGPPSMNGFPGIHHIYSRIIKDIVYRFYTINNYSVINKLGWDTHGLPIELSIENKLKIKKSSIGKTISIKEFNNKCKKFVNKNIQRWIKFTNKIGYFFNKKNCYNTYNSKYIESIWWIIKKIAQKKLLYKDYKVLPYSPMAGTSISYQELNFPNTKKKIYIYSLYLFFKLKKILLFKKYTNDSIYVLVWTTTPWTLPANTALLIKKNINYLLVKFNKIYFITSESSIKNIFNNNSKYIIICKFSGKKILGLKYYPIFKWKNILYNNKKKFIIIDDSLNIVKINKGTGIIHISPPFGKDDYEISKKNKISSVFYKNSIGMQVPMVDKYGRYVENIPFGLGGKYVKYDYYKKNGFSVDKKIIDLLRKKKYLFRANLYKKKYPHCWRTNKPIIYYPIKSWFLKLNRIKKKIINLSKKINWCTPLLIKNKFLDWLNNIKDWNISRTRYWGTPIPIWTNKNNKEYIIIESIKDLNNRIDRSIKVGNMKRNPIKKWIVNNKVIYNKINLHKDFLDKIILSSKSGEKMYRDKDVLDVWFDSGSSTYAQYHYPFENKRLVNNKIIYPSNFISEGSDQIRGWFFSLHIISTIISNNIAYKNILPLGLILDKYGKKMSKSKGNTLNPFNIIKKYGPDSIRWFLVYNNTIGESIKFNTQTIENINNNFFNTLYNVYLFLHNYSKIDKIKYKRIKKLYLKNKIFLLYIDRWIISKLNKILKKIHQLYKIFNFTKISRIIGNFLVNDLSNWYIRLSRTRFWKNKNDNYKMSAYYTLYYTLYNILLISHPIIPFISEYIYINLFNKNGSILLEKFNKGNKILINNSIEKSMECIREYTKIVLSLRKKKNIKVRQPLRSIYIVINNKNISFKNNPDVISLLKKEVNIKKVIFIQYNKIDKYVKKKIKINYNIIGPKYKNLVKDISIALNKLTKDDMNFFLKKKYLYLKKFKIRLTKEDISIVNESLNNNIIYSNNNTTIILNTELNKELLEEGWIRDLIRKIQLIRKSKNLNIVDKINIFFYKKNHTIINKVLNKYSKKILKETLSKKIIYINKKLKNKILYKNQYILFDIR